MTLEVPENLAHCFESQVPATEKSELLRSLLQEIIPRHQLIEAGWNAACEVANNGGTPHLPATSKNLSQGTTKSPPHPTASVVRAKEISTARSGAVCIGEGVKMPASYRRAFPLCGID